MIQNFNVNKIKGLMAERKDTIQDLSNVLNIHRNSLSFKLNGKRDFTVKELETIANHYHVDIEIFFKASGYET